MKQNLIKTFAIIILAAINLFLLISLTNHSSQIKYYDEELISATVEYMKTNGMIADDSLIPRRRESFSVFAGVYDVSLILRDTDKFFPSGGVSVYALPSGAVLLTDAEGGYARFGTNMDLKFRAAGYDGDFAPTSGAVTSEAALDERLENEIKAFLSPVGVNTGAGALSANVVGALYCEESGVSAVECREASDGIPMYGFTVTVYLKDGEIIGADGKWCFNPPSSKINAETQDVISILINESGRLRTEYKAALKEDPAALMPAYIVSGINANYYIYSDDDGNVYFVPVYVISYKDRSGSVYNTVSGRMISVTDDGEDR